MKKRSSSFGALFAEARERDDYWVAKASLEFTEEISRLLATLHVTRSELARRLGTSTAYVTKILRGDVNFTLQTMVRLARALGAEVKPLVWQQSAQGATVATAPAHPFAAAASLADPEWRGVETRIPVTPHTSMLSFDSIDWRARGELDTGTAVH